MNNRAINFTEGKILGPLLRFAVPILAAAFLHALYGAVDLLIVGRFSLAADVSGVSTGSMLMSTLTSLVASLSIGLTVFLAEMIGQKNEEECGRIIGSGIVMFFVIAVAMMAVISGGAVLFDGSVRGVKDLKSGTAESGPA